MTNRPNVLVMVADDHRYESLGVHGNSEVATPHLDALAARGLVCHQAHCQGGMHGAICVPSRASLMTGRNIFASAEDPTGRDYRASLTIPDSLTTFPERLRAAGYRTHAIGKWHNDAASFQRSFTSAERVMFGGNMTACRFTPTTRRVTIRRTPASMKQGSPQTSLPSRRCAFWMNKKMAIRG